MDIQAEITLIKRLVHDPLEFALENLSVEKESQEYNACRFLLNENMIISRTAKVTPTKIGQFVTLWKRNGDGPIQPFSTSDDFDLVIINTHFKDQFGQFVFPKSLLKTKGILSTSLKEGKRGFRVYPPWDKATSKQALTTQKWQIEYFLKMDPPKEIDLDRANFLYSQS